ncbi:rhodanese-like domain-containing protein [Epibacterium sp. SM1969]|uniref:Rhodanese-like domain-containing protein n=1 Tax=Tritonibacter aquimaris TaxID=2663379 RepID=A0A844ATA2_9RHOB|nr:rhodanese-like domain-containing protein [Tritonibacter aquimaris]
MGKGAAVGRVTRRNIVLAGGVFTLASALGVQQYFTPPAHDRARLTVQQAYDGARTGQILLVDIRTPREWRASGVPEGAILLDMRREDFVAALSQHVQGQTDRPIALICARGVRSARMTLRLVDAGFTQIIDVPEGMLGSKAGPGWIRSKLPVLKWNGTA